MNVIHKYMIYFHIIYIDELLVPIELLLSYFCFMTIICVENNIQMFIYHTPELQILMNDRILQHDYQIVTSINAESEVSAISAWCFEHLRKFFLYKSKSNVKSEQKSSILHSNNAPTCPRAALPKSGSKFIEIQTNKLSQHISFCSTYKECILYQIWKFKCKRLQLMEIIIIMNI